MMRRGRGVHVFETTKRTVQELSESRSTRETVRAFAVFGVLSFTLLGIAGYLALRELDLGVLERRFARGLEEAHRIADVVAAIGRDGEGLDFHRLRQSRGALETVVDEMVQSRGFLRFVEIRDRFGARLLYVAREGVPGATGGGVRPAPALDDEEVGGPGVITVDLVGAGSMPAGQVRVGLADAAVRRELAALRRALRIQILVAASAGILLLVAGLFYVLRLIRKNRRLEMSRLAAERRSYVGLLASGLAHEIRNPLNAMNMNLQMLEEELQLGGSGAPPEDSAELLDQTKSEIKRLERLVTNFLTYARPAAPQFEAHDLNEVLQGVCRFLEADFRTSGVELRFEPEPMLPRVQFDDTQFKQAVMNLLVNARQVLKKGGTVLLRTRAGSQGDVVIEVQDDGPGIPEDARDRIFDVFFSNRGGGTGLGLPIARQIVDRHGGRLDFDTELGRGTTFRIHVPRRQERVAAGNAP